MHVLQGYVNSMFMYMNMFMFRKIFVVIFESISIS